MTVPLTIPMDHADLALTHGPTHYGGAIDAHGYARDVLHRALMSYPFLDRLPASIILRLVPGLPECVVTCRDGDAILDRTIAFLALAGEPKGIVPIVVNNRISISADQMYPGLLNEAEYIVLEPHTDEAHPGRRYIAWVTEYIYGDVDDRMAGPWYAASPMAALCAAVDYREQRQMGEPFGEESFPDEGTP